MLNNTPVFDIKPYIPEYDSFPEAETGWMENIIDDTYEIKYSEIADAKKDFINSQGIEIDAVIDAQLGHDVFDKTRNKFIKDENGYILRFKSWRILFNVNDKKVFIKDIFSGYTDFSAKLGNDTEEDVAVHRRFCDKFLF